MIMITIKVEDNIFNNSRTIQISDDIPIQSTVDFMIDSIIGDSGGAFEKYFPLYDSRKEAINDLFDITIDNI